MGFLYLANNTGSAGLARRRDFTLTRHDLGFAPYPKPEEQVVRCFKRLEKAGDV